MYFPGAGRFNVIRIPAHFIHSLIEDWLRYCLANLIPQSERVGHAGHEVKAAKMAAANDKSVGSPDVVTLQHPAAQPTWKL